MTDLRIRELERAAAAGDRTALERLERALTRAALPPWLRKLNAIRSALSALGDKHKRRRRKLNTALDILQAMYEAADEGTWPLVMDHATAAEQIIRTCSIDSVDIPVDLFFTEAWKMCGQPGRDPRKHPTCGDVVGSRTIIYVDFKYGTRNGYGTCARQVRYKCSARRLETSIALSKWRVWARAKPVIKRNMYDGE